MEIVEGLGVTAGLNLRANRTKGKLTWKHGAGRGKGERSRWGVVRGAHHILTIWVATKDKSVIVHEEFLNLTSLLAGV